jgi:large subunit ribosomal protein L17
MRHAKHKHQLGRKKEHRQATMANLASALFKHSRIKTTLAKAKALRPFAEKVVTLARKASVTTVSEEKLHYRRQAIAKVRDRDVIKHLFDETVKEFVSRPGGYTRIYKLGNRTSTDAAEMALIELIPASDEGYKKQRRKKVSSIKQVKAIKTQPTTSSETSAGSDAVNA